MRLPRDVTRHRLDIFSTQYDAQGRVLREESPTGAVNSEYDPVTGLRRRSFTGASSCYAGDQAKPVNDVRFDYDPLGRLLTVSAVERNDVVIDTQPTEPGNQPETTRYYYDLAGNLDRADLANEAVTDYRYDSLNRLSSLTHYAPDGTPANLENNPKISEFQYTVRADGKRTAAAETFWLDSDGNGTAEAHASTYDWVYDDLGRLTSEAIDHWDGQFDRAESFVYDLASNRTRREVDTDGQRRNRRAHLEDRLRRRPRRAHPDPLRVRCLGRHHQPGDAHLRPRWPRQRPRPAGRRRRAGPGLHLRRLRPASGDP